MNIYDKITKYDKIVCFIEGSNTNSILIIYKKDMLKTQFYEAVISLIDRFASTFLITVVTLCGYEKENSKELKTIFNGSYTYLQNLIRGVI